MKKVVDVTGKKKMNKGKKAGIIIGAVLAVIVVIALIYGFVITKSGYWLLSKLTPDTQEQKMAYTSASDTTQVIADEGFVLMQNNENLLPLTTSADNRQGINIFGMRGVQLVYNAGGSASSDVSGCVRLEDALTGDQGNFALNEDLLHLYYNYFQKGRLSIDKTAAPTNVTDSEFIEQAYRYIFLPEFPAETFTDTGIYNDGRTILDHAYDFSDVAMIVLGRGGGEMMDFTPGELQLTDEEAAMVDAVCGKFDKVILVLNCANAMELGFLEDYPSIKSVIWIGYPGESGINALARILNGTVNPSGHLADTWLKDNMASPAANNYLELQADGTWGTPSANPFGTDNYHYTNAPEAEGYFVKYSEGIYVGYKYFETRHDTDPGYIYENDVMFPFGHGLSYTAFNKKIMAMNEEDGVITVRVEVTNTGAVSGKDVIQIYYNPPYTGAIEKSTVNLAAFRKTNIIQPGETEYYSIEFNVEDMASFDYKINNAYVLEKGEYEIMLREDSHTLLDSEKFILSRDIIYNDGNDGKRSSDMQAAVSRFDDALGADDYLTRDWDLSSRAFTGPLAEDYTASQEVLDAIAGKNPPTDAELGLVKEDMPAVGVTFDVPIMLSDMVGVEYDDPKWDEFISQLTLNEMSLLNGNGGYHIEEINRLGVPRTYAPDGPTSMGTSVYSGAMMGYEANGVTYPCPVVIASTWNEEVSYMMGTSVGNEAQAMGFTGWYAPAMNTHRLPFDGRNFEYYSEDSVLAGITAGNVVRGVTEKGVICFIKHFAMNDRESNCRSQLFTWSNEQAIREIYLKPFEMAVKNGGAMGAMSSFNYIGTTWSGANYNLLTEVLRNEWGFRGAVVSDAGVYSFMDPVLASYAGGNLSLDAMGAMTPFEGHAGLLLKAAQNSDTEIGMAINLHQSCKNILYVVSRTWKVTGTTD